MELTAVFKKVPEGYIAWVEELPGANTQGATPAEAEENLLEAIRLAFEAERDLHGTPLPSEFSMKNQDLPGRRVKLRELTLHLEAYGCRLLREGSRHTHYLNPANQKPSAIPRHAEINDILARKVCWDLGIPKP